MPGIGIGANIAFGNVAPGGGIPGVLSAGSGFFQFTGQAAGVRKASIIAAASGAFSFAGQAATLIAKHVVAAAQGDFLFSGQAATLTKGSGARVMGADAGAFAFAGDTMVPLQDFFTSAEAGAFSFSGQAASPIVARKTAAANGGFTFAGQDATLTKSGSYTGPGDVVSGAYVWYGLRAYNAAYATGSNPALDLVDQAGANAVTINILADGRLDVASISAWVAANSVSTIKVKRWYDQSGSARHLDQTTLTNMPVLNLTGFGSLPAITTDGTVPHHMTSGASGTFAKSQPITYSFVYTYGGRQGEAFAHFGTFINTVSGGFKVRAGNNPSASTAADGSWHAAQGVINTTSSATYIDGSATTGISSGSNNPNNAVVFNQNVDFQNPSNSYAEFGIWDIAFNSTQAGDMNTNQHGTSGYNF